MEYLSILGRQRGLAISELSALYGKDNLRRLNDEVCSLSVEPEQQRFGSVIKTGGVLFRHKEPDWQTALLAAQEHLPHVDGKLKIGVSIYGTDVSARQMNRATLDFKKRLRAAGISLRLVPNRKQHLNAAQVLYNKLIQEKGVELLISVQHDHCIVAKTTAVQDIDEYTLRDRQKPVRDAKVGMLPPKLAQTLLNLTQLQPGQTVLDPFCGSGTVLMEALLDGAHIIGTDLSADMVSAARQNCDWLKDRYGTKTEIKQITKADAQAADWDAFDAIACETYLGPPLQSAPLPHELEKIIQELDVLHERFFQNVARQTPVGTNLAIALPAWRVKKSFRTLPVVDRLTDLGYNFTSFSPSGTEGFYHRPGQFVARQIVALTRSDKG